MSAIGIGLLWFGYWAGVSGVSMVKGWNNSPLQLANPVRVAAFTTQCYTGSGVFPTGASSDSGACSGGSSGSSVASQTNIDKGQLAGTNKGNLGLVGRGYHGA